MQLVYGANIIVICGYILAFFIDKTLGLALPRQVFGSVFFLLPALNSVLMLQRLFRTQISNVSALLLVIVFSVLNLPLLLYTSYVRGHTLTPYSVLYSLTVLTVAPLVLIHIKDLWERTFRLTLATELGLKARIARHRGLIWALAVYGAVMTINFLLYRFIPEADGYRYLKTVEGFTAGELQGGVGSRPLFIVLMTSFAIVTKIAPYILFKYFLPLGLGTLIIVYYFYLFGRNPTQKNLTILALFPLSIPVVVMEILIPRPQSIILLLLPIVAYFYSVADKTRNAWLLFIAIGISLVSVLYHELGLFLIVLIPFMILHYFWSDIKGNPKFAAGLIIYGLIGLYPYVAQTGLIALLRKYCQLGWDALSSGHFNWWFISHYINVDGNVVGWPGYSWVLYYGYNLGLVVPLVLIWLVLKRKSNLSLAHYTANCVLAGFFFIVAEILPRFGLGFLPDRAWLFFELTITPLLILIAGQLIQDKKWKTAYVIVLILSIGTSFYVTYKKQGWITTSEYRATRWLNQTTEPSAIIVTQPGNNPLASYYIKREYYTLSTKKDTIFDTLNLLRSNPSLALTGYNELIVQRGKHVADIEQAVESLVAARDQATAGASEQKLVNASREIVTIRGSLDALEKEKLHSNIPVYFLYSSDKDTGLYSQREWWRVINWRYFDTSAIDKQFSRIYDRDNVIIWKIK